MIGLYIAIGVLSLLAALIAIVLIRALTFNVKRSENQQPESVEVDKERAVAALAEMIKCKTVSHKNRAEDDEAEFIKFKEILPEMFPNVYAKCEYSEPSERTLLFKYKGKSSSSPTVLMAHYDVVSVETSQWQKPPFDAVREDGVLWGRGTLDTKVTLNGAMQAMESLITQGFVPENDIYLAFAGDEEINGTGALAVVDLFEREGIKPGLVLDEGGAVVQNVFPGVSAPCALVGIAEKGMVNLEFTYSGNGGHSSSPKPHTPVGKLSRACVNIENHPFKYRLSSATRQMFDTLARNSTFLYKIIFANLWLFSPVLDLICRKSGGELNALVRTTCAFTQMEGSKGINVIPPNARMCANLRIIPGETVEDAVAYVKKVVGDPEICVNVINGNDPSVTSEVACEGYNRVAKAINATWRDAIVSPYLMFAGSDSRHWGRISDRVFRFSAMALTSAERATIHGNDEKITEATVEKCVEFYVRIIKMS